MAAVVQWTWRFVANPLPNGFWYAITIFAAAAATLYAASQWKLRIDATGVWRRRFHCWDFWPWADLASGRIHKRAWRTLYDPERSWWCRELRLEPLADADRDEAMSLINAHYRLPPPPELPDEISFYYDAFRSMTLSGKELAYLIGKESSEYSWDDVENVHIERADPLRRDFFGLAITLPNQEIEVRTISRLGPTHPPSRGRTCEVINEFLFRNLPADRIDVTMFGKPPTKREHLEKKLQAAERSARQDTITGRFVWPFFVGVLIWVTVEGLVEAAVQLTIFLAVTALAFGRQSRLKNKQIADLRSALDAAIDTEQRPAQEVAN